MHRKRGETHNFAKLKMDDVIGIREWFSIGARNVDIARWYDVHPVTIGHIVKRRTWSHV